MGEIHSEVWWELGGGGIVGLRGEEEDDCARSHHVFSHLQILNTDVLDTHQANHVRVYVTRLQIF